MKQYRASVWTLLALWVMIPVGCQVKTNSDTNAPVADFSNSAASADAQTTSAAEFGSEAQRPPGFGVELQRPPGFGTEENRPSGFQ